MNDFTDISNELISAEQLQIFDVVDTYCEVCQDQTPHHMDTSKIYEQDEEVCPDAVLAPALSQKECVFCRENEENELKGLQNP